MTDEQPTPEQERIARLQAAFDKAKKETVDEDALPEGVNPENFQEPAEEATPEEATAEPEAPKVDDEAKRRAVAALLRSGFDQAEIDAMPVERVLERGLKRHEILARDDDAHRRVRALEPSPKETPQVASEPAAPKPELAGVPEVDFKQAVKPFAEQYGLDEAGAEALAAAFKATVGPLATDVNALKSERQAEAIRTLETMVSSARSTLTESIPGLADESTFGEVVEDMVALQNQPRFQAIADPTERTRAVMQAAARSRGLHEQAPDAEEPTKTTRIVRTVKQEAGTRLRAEARELSETDKQWAVYKNIRKLPEGPTRATEARKLAGLV